MTLLVDAPLGRHLAQFHRDPEALLESIFVFLEAGLRGGTSILVIADREQVGRLFERLTSRRYHAASLQNSGQLVALDGPSVIEQVMLGEVAGEPQWPVFRKLMEPVLTRMRPFGRGTRIYTEVANELWNAGHTDAAIRVEEFWNTLAESFQFTLYCGYTGDTHSEGCYAGPLEELGRTHTDILGGPEDEQFGLALDRASKEIFGIPLTQMAGVSRHDGARRFPSGQRTMLWVKRNLPMSATQLVERARVYFANGSE